ncbi:MAG: rhomboid family intramembrane serine protease [Phycisphaeraceae bacterium JB051]
MGVYDRDYTQADSPFGPSKRVGNFLIPAPGWLSMVAILIIINVAVFVVDAILFNFAKLTFNGMAPLEGIGYFSFVTAFEHFQVWRVVSYQFLHANVGHVFWNMLGLFFFGPMVENYLGSKRFLAYYLLCGVAGSLFYVLMMLMHILPEFNGQSGYIPLVGASAGLFGVMVAAARISPNTQVLFMFIIPIKMRVMIWMMVGVAALTLLSRGNNAGGEAAHLGGAILGFFLIRKPGLLNFADIGGSRRSKPTLAQRANQWKANRDQKSQQELDEEVDRILAKVKASGIQSLSEKEKKTLNKATNQQRRG